jgi:hypothetical protein
MHGSCKATSRLLLLLKVLLHEMDEAVRVNVIWNHASYRFRMLI